MKFLKKIKESRLNLILMLLYPIVTFYLLEWFTHNPWKTMKATPQVLNIVMFELVALLLEDGLSLDYGSFIQVVLHLLIRVAGSE